MATTCFEKVGRKAIAWLASWRKLKVLHTTGFWRTWRKPQGDEASQPTVAATSEPRRLLVGVSAVLMIVAGFWLSHRRVAPANRLVSNVPPTAPHATPNEGSSPAPGSNSPYLPPSQTWKYGRGVFDPHDKQFPFKLVQDQSLYAEPSLNPFLKALNGGAMGATRAEPPKQIALKQKPQPAENPQQEQPELLLARLESNFKVAGFDQRTLNISSLLAPGLARLATTNQALANQLLERSLWNVYLKGIDDNCASLLFQAKDVFGQVDLRTSRDFTDLDRFRLRSSAESFNEFVNHSRAAFRLLSQRSFSNARDAFDNAEGDMAWVRHEALSNIASELRASMQAGVCAANLCSEQFGMAKVAAETGLSSAHDARLISRLGCLKDLADAFVDSRRARIANRKAGDADPGLLYTPRPGEILLQQGLNQSLWNSAMQGGHVRF